VITLVRFLMAAVALGCARAISQRIEEPDRPWHSRSLWWSPEVVVRRLTVLGCACIAFGIYVLFRG